MEELAPGARVEITTPYYKPWTMPDAHIIVKASKKCLKNILKKEDVIVWGFCTNGSYTAGEKGIPTIGFGPGCESEAHSAEEKIQLSDIGAAIEFFSALPAYISAEGEK